MAHPKLILLIEDDPDYEQLVRAVFSGSGNALEIRSAESLASGLVSIARYKPDVILLDLSLPDCSGYETFLRVRECAGETPIIVLTGLDDDQVAIQAVEDGAQDYLVKSLTQPNLIARSMKMAVSRQNRQSRLSPGGVDSSATFGMILSFIGSKGGVGTTTAAVNIGALLAENGFETAVIELQPGRPGSLSRYLQIPPARGLSWLLERPADTITPSDLQQCLVEVRPGFRLLCPAPSPGTWRALSADHVHAIVAAARRVCRFAVLDLPSQIDEGVAEALKLSDSTTMMVDREWASLGCGATLLEQIKVATGSNDVRLVVVERTGLEAPPLEDLKNQFKMHPLAILPAAGAAIALSHAARTPLVVLYPDCPLSRAHFELAERLLPNVAASRHVSSAGSEAQFSRTANWPAIPETMYG
jgi:DNA-binding response OmpR family regulator